MEIIAHRGASYDAPENTMAAVILAWKQGADAVEVDVQLSRDGRLMVVHDDNTQRTGGHRRLVSRQTVAELRRLDVGSWKGKTWQGERIPTLEEVMDSVPSGKRLFVEIKCPESGVRDLARCCRRIGRRTRAVVPIGFSLATMRLVKSYLPHLEVGAVIKFQRHTVTRRWRPRPADVLRQCREHGLNAIDCGSRGPITPEFVQRTHDAGLGFYVWTVDEPSLANQLQACGVDGLTTNRPGWMRERLTDG